MSSDQRDQFSISLAVDGGRFQLREPWTAAGLFKNAYPRIRFHFNLNGLHDSIWRCSIMEVRLRCGFIDSSLYQVAQVVPSLSSLDRVLAQFRGDLRPDRWALATPKLLA